MKRPRVTGALAIRRYRPADAERVRAVHEAALRASPVEFVPDAPADADLREISARYLDAGGEFLVGEVGGEIVAAGGFRPRGDAAELRRLRVHPDHQRRGYATRLLSRLEARAADAGFDALALETDERLTAARELYAARGYEEVGRESRPATDADRVRYRKKLE